MMQAIRGFLKRSPFLVAVVHSMRTGKQELRVVRWRFSRQRLIGSYLESHPTRKLQLGSRQNYLEGWLNTDLLPDDGRVMYLDARRAFPFDDGVFDYVFNEHLIEHLTYHDGLFMLTECYRILKQGGKIRIATPNLDNLIGLYNPEKTAAQRRYIEKSIDAWLPEIGERTECFVINNTFRNWGHQFIYDSRTLRGALEKAGFENVMRYAPGESDDANLQRVEQHGKVIADEEMNEFDTMVMEAVRRA